MYGCSHLTCMSVPVLDNSITKSPLRKMFRPHRILIMKSLEQANREGVSFQQLKEIFNLTDGNLASHLKSLEDEGYIAYIKENEGHRTRTVYRLTPEGKAILDLLTEQLFKILDSKPK